MPQIETTEHYQPLIDKNHPNYKSRYLVWYGGRGGAKSWQVAAGLIFRATTETVRVLCCREFQNSIADSVLKLLEDTIERLGVAHLFKVQNNVIYGPNGSEFNFKGLHHNISSIKSFEGVDIVWIEEGQTVSKKSWQVLVPTIRKSGSQIIVTFNPDQEDDPTYVRFITNPPPDSYVCKVNWEDNPWFTPELDAERIHCMETDPEGYANIWGGDTWHRSDSQILNGKWVVMDFEPRMQWGEPLYGADWGFSRDPTVLSKMWIFDRILYIERESCEIGLELDDTKREWEEKMPGCAKRVIKSDNARPETISYLKRHGIPLLKAAPKWKGSVEDGITHLRSYKKIVIHTRCKNAQKEARMYRYKLDPRTGDVTKKIIDKNNHSVDSWRYGLDKLIKRSGIDYKTFNQM